MGVTQKAIEQAAAQALTQAAITNTVPPTNTPVIAEATFTPFGSSSALDPAAASTLAAVITQQAAAQANAAATVAGGQTQLAAVQANAAATAAAGQTQLANSANDPAAASTLASVLTQQTVGQRDGVANLIGGFPEIAEVEFLPHPSLFRAINPERDIRVAQRDPAAFVATLNSLFPEEKAGIAGLFDHMTGLASEVGRLQTAKGQVDMSRFPVDYPHLARFHQSTWGPMVDARVTNPKLKTILSSQWGYYGLPPSRLSCFYYAMPFMGYLKEGGFYPKGRSQDISNAFARFIEKRGGRSGEYRFAQVRTRPGARGPKPKP